MPMGPAPRVLRTRSRGHEGAPTSRSNQANVRPPQGTQAHGEFISFMRASSSFVICQRAIFQLVEVPRKLLLNFFLQNRHRSPKMAGGFVLVSLYMPAKSGHIWKDSMSEHLSCKHPGLLNMFHPMRPRTPWTKKPRACCSRPESQRLCPMRTTLRPFRKVKVTDAFCVGRNG